MGGILILLVLNGETAGNVIDRGAGDDHVYACTEADVACGGDLLSFGCRGSAAQSGSGDRARPSNDGRFEEAA